MIFFRCLAAILVPCTLYAFGALALDAEDSWQLSAPQPVIAIEIDGEPPTSACASCHSEVAREWSISAHALAWDDEEYQKSLKRKRRSRACHGCHAPLPLLAGRPLDKKPDARKELRSHGVSCESCHLGPEGEMLGNHGTSVEAHASGISLRMSTPGSNELCSTCHSTTIGPVIGLGKDFEKSGQAERGRSCVGCHMALVERPWADGTGVPVRSGRSHALQTPRDPAFLRRAFSFRTDGSVLEIKNEAGHRVPGLVGREILLRVELIDAKGEPLESTRVQIDTKSYLPVDGTRTIRFAASGSGVRVFGEHIDPRSKEPVVFLDELFEP